MIRSRHLVRGGISLLVVGLVSAACSEMTAPEDVAALETRPEFALESTTPISCPNNQFKYALGIVDSRGGEIEVDGNRVVIPPGAVNGLTIIRMLLPVSDRLEVELMAGSFGHDFQFKKPVSVTLSYAHCGSSLALSAGDRTAWYVDEGTGEFLERMPSHDDAAAGTISFMTPHFSHFVVAD